MNNNQATIEKLEKMGLWGMMRAFRATMDAGAKGDFTPDELLSHLVDAEWDERRNRRLSRLLKMARFRYKAGFEDIDFGLKRNLEKNAILRLSDCRWVTDHQDVILTGPCGSGNYVKLSLM
jgi:DNA replication protein DnaC